MGGLARDEIVRARDRAMRAHEPRWNEAAGNPPVPGPLPVDIGGLYRQVVDVGPEPEHRLQLTVAQHVGKRHAERGAQRSVEPGARGGSDERRRDRFQPEPIVVGDRGEPGSGGQARIRVGKVPLERSGYVRDVVRHSVIHGVIHDVIHRNDGRRQRRGFVQRLDVVTSVAIHAECERPCL